MPLSRVRQNYWATLTAAVAVFVLEAIWYTAFQQPWMRGVSTTREMLMRASFNPAFQYATAFVMAILIAAAISCIIQLTGPQSAMRGMRIGALVWAQLCVHHLCDRIRLRGQARPVRD
jgi:hypothetical protein